MPKKRVGPRSVKSTHPKPNPITQLNDVLAKLKLNCGKLRRMKSATTSTKRYKPRKECFRHECKPISGRSRRPGIARRRLAGRG